MASESARAKPDGVGGESQAEVHKLWLLLADFDNFLGMIQHCIDFISERCEKYVHEIFVYENLVLFHTESSG